MGKRSDMPVFDKPMLVRAGDATAVVWGDETAGYVNDEFHAYTRQLLLITISMPPGKSFYHAPTLKPVYTGNAGLYVLQGQYTIQLPDTGEIKVAEAGEMFVMRGTQWHFGYNFSDRELRVLETIAPPSAPGSLDALACPAPELYLETAAAKNFPATRPGAKLEVVGRKSALNMIHGRKQPALLRLLACTPKMSVALLDLIGGQRTEAFRFDRDSTVYAEKGRLHLRIPAEGTWDRLDPGDAYFLPAGTAWELFNHGAGAGTAHIAVGGNFADSLQAS
jgi:quercetin dioxygenase-like cupin family protein